MWFALGFVTLAISVGYQWWMRWHYSWSGTEDSLGGIQCQSKVRSHRDWVYGLLVGLRAPETFRFELKREGDWDRFFKWAGLTVEHQFGHAGFDSLVYVASDDQHLFDSLAGNKDFLHSAQHIFAAESEDRWIKKIVCARGRLWLVIGCSDGFEEASTERNRIFAADLLPHLQQIQKELAACKPDTRPAERDRYLVPSMVILAMSSGLAVNGAISWARSFISPEFILDTRTLNLYAWAVAICILMVLILATLIFLRGSSRVHLVLLELVLVGTFGAVTTASNGLRNANIDFDTSLATQVQRPLAGKFIEERKRLLKPTRRTYYLQYREWFGEEELRSISVSAETYERASNGDKLEFEQHQGFLGWRWARYRAWRPASAT